MDCGLLVTKFYTFNSEFLCRVRKSQLRKFSNLFIWGSSSGETIELPLHSRGKGKRNRRSKGREWRHETHRPTHVHHKRPFVSTCFPFTNDWRFRQRSSEGTREVKVEWSSRNRRVRPDRRSLRPFPSKNKTRLSLGQVWVPDKMTPSVFSNLSVEKSGVSLTYSSLTSQGTVTRTSHHGRPGNDHRKERLVSTPGTQKGVYLRST